jgi:hypothetical protein
MQDADNVNEWVNWIEEAITKKQIKHYVYDQFHNIEKVGSGSFGKVYRANWKNSHKYLALKSFFNLNNATVKEIVNEVIILQYIPYYNSYIGYLII